MADPEVKADDAAAAPAPDAGEAAAVTNAPMPLSNKQMKKALKRERNEERKKLRKVEEKEKRKVEMEKRRLESQARYESLSPEEQARLKAEKVDKRAARQQEEKDKKEKLKGAVKTGQPLVIDLEFGSLMHPGEIKSLMQQMMICYASNNRATRPYRLTFTGVSGNMKDSLEALPGFDKWIIGDVAEGSYLDLFKDRTQDLVYLTADSDNEITKLDDSKVYIIGGIVDRNRHKNITQIKAEKQGIATARLPIDKYMKLAASCVLTVNQVLDIMLFYHDTAGGDWKEALDKAVPPRKRAAGGGGAGGGGEGEGEGEGAGNGEGEGRAAKVARVGAEGEGGESD